ncbi:hypothetical protein [Rhizobium leguminosarum]|uniref:hypothetical protein n=1 Tax=Rhizobium leguminosarum TaxID=384 RepID=UPI0010305A72|nr:hypothetical protein [Rhizobium leguminosarum]TAY99676.1 hypothetical protein ELH79_14825 [Rhizobium leguminosarum]TAZ10546.1 hypothetical protein ELH78_15710 [Rhizobium leguminosarum]
MVATSDPHEDVLLELTPDFLGVTLKGSTVGDPDEALPLHLRGIHQHGLTVGDVVTNFERFEGRIAVWLTSSTNPDGHGLGNSRVEETEFRLTVDVDENDERFWWYCNWARENLDVATQLRIHMAAGWASSSWFLWFGRVPPENILEVVSTKTGSAVENWGNYYPEVLSVRPVSYEGRHGWHQRTIRDVKRALARQAG